MSEEVYVCNLESRYRYLYLNGSRYCLLDNEFIIIEPTFDVIANRGLATENLALLSARVMMFS